MAISDPEMLKKMVEAAKYAPGISPSIDWGRLTRDMPSEQFRREDSDRLTYLGMIAMRFHLAPGSALPFEFINAHRHGDTVHVFVISDPMDKDAAVLKDTWDLFPSDTLITQLRLLAK